MANECAQPHYSIFKIGGKEEKAAQQEWLVGTDFLWHNANLRGEAP
jgi:hypothetical protein